MDNSLINSHNTLSPPISQECGGDFIFPTSTTHKQERKESRKIDSGVRIRKKIPESRIPESQFHIRNLASTQTMRKYESNPESGVPEFVTLR